MRLPKPLGNDRKNVFPSGQIEQTQLYFYFYFILLFCHTMNYKQNKNDNK